MNMNHFQFAKRVLAERYKVNISDVDVTWIQQTSDNRLLVKGVINIEGEAKILSDIVDLPNDDQQQVNLPATKKKSRSKK